MLVLQQLLLIVCMGDGEAAIIWRPSSTQPSPALPRSQVQCPAARLQSILTGESGSVDKHTEAVMAAKAVVQDKTNMLFSVSSFFA